MPSAAPTPKPIPPPQVPLIDPQTGLMAKDWYDFFTSQAQVLRVVRQEIP